MSIFQKLIGAGIAYIITICMGIFLSRIGKPYNTALFNVHKLVALAAVILTVLMFKDILKTIKPEIYIIILIIVAVIAIIVIFATGAFLSIGNTPYILIKTIHIVSQFIFIISVALSVYLILKK